MKDNEIYGSGNAYSAEYWEHDARLLRRWNTDPITYDWQSTYACFNNNPVYYADPLGLEGTNGTRPGNDGEKRKNKRKANGSEPVKKDDGTQPKGSELPNETVSNGDGSVNRNENNPAGDPCFRCGANGETVWGIPEPTTPASSETSSSSLIFVMSD